MFRLPLTNQSADTLLSSISRLTFVFDIYRLLCLSILPGFYTVSTFANMETPEPEVRRIFCAAVGAGMCGVSLGTQLLKTKTLSHDELRIFDRNNDFGGVWKSNTYPGVACDIPSHAYAMRMFLNAGKS